MSFVKPIPPLFENQEETIEFHMANDRVYDASDPGTGKTRSTLEAILRKQKLGAGKALIFAPKSILVPSWADDLRKFTPELSYVVANANNRAKAFKQDADVYITNHDAVKWVQKHVDLTNFDIMVSDEHTAYKHRTSQRAKALAAIRNYFDLRIALSGTMNPNGNLDLWHQFYVLDDGARLGTNFWQFRNKVCEAVQTGPRAEMQKWVDRPGAAEAIADIIADMTIRHKFEDCQSIPAHSINTVFFDLSAKHLKMYKELEKMAIIMLRDKVVSAVHKGALRTKLLQLASGAVYDAEHASVVASTDRYELVLDLAEARESCVIAFNWTHQRDQMIEMAKARGLTWTLIDGSVKQADRTQAVNDFQTGRKRIMFAQPASAAHGLTLTRGTTTIWPGPIDNAEHFQQFNRRIYRAGQTRKTETIMVAAHDTLEDGVYERLQGKIGGMDDLLGILTGSDPDFLEELEESVDMT